MPLNPTSLLVLLSLTCITCAPLWAQQDLWEVPVISGESAGFPVRTHVLRLSPSARTVLQTERPYWITASTSLPDSGYSTSDIGKELITRASFGAYELKRYERPITVEGHGTWWQWYASWTSDGAQDSGCGSETNIWSGIKVLDHDLISICDEYCATTAQEIETIPNVSATAAQDSIRLAWTAHQLAVDYGILVWTARPTESDIGLNLAYASKAIATPPQGHLTLPRNPQGSTYVGLWAKSITPANAACIDYPHPSVHPRYILDIIVIESNNPPSAIKRSDWGGLKNDMHRNTKK